MPAITVCQVFGTLCVRALAGAGILGGDNRDGRRGEALLYRFYVMGIVRGQFPLEISLGQITAAHLTRRL